MGGFGFGGFPPLAQKQERAKDGARQSFIEPWVGNDGDGLLQSGGDFASEGVFSAACSASDGLRMGPDSPFDRARKRAEIFYIFP